MNLCSDIESSWDWKKIRDFILDVHQTKSSEGGFPDSIKEKLVDVDDPTTENVQECYKFEITTS